MIIRNPYKYATLERTTADNGVRFYLDPVTQEPLPSVTTILSHTADKSFLVEWVARVGEKKAEQIRDEAAGLGTLVHTHMECHIQGIPRPSGNNMVRQLATRMADVIINHPDGLPNVQESWGIEIPLYFPQIYAGTTDLVGVYNGKPAIMDYKNTKKMKTKDMITDYFCQCVAYALAHNFLYETSIQQVVIFMVARDLQFQTFVVEGAEFGRYADMWIERCRIYDESTSQKSIVGPASTVSVAPGVA